MIRGVDFFAGVGTYTAAMRELGIEVVGACERDSNKRAEYVRRHAKAAWFGEDCMRDVAPEADLWTACASVPDLQLWLGRAGSGPSWLLLECVGVDLPELMNVAMEFAKLRCDPITLARAGKRVFVVIGPQRVIVNGPLPPHDGQGPESDPVALRLVLGAILEKAP